MRDRAGTCAPDERCSDRWAHDTTLLRAFGVGLHETIAYLYNEAPSYEAFTAWVLAHDTARGNAPDAYDPSADEAVLSPYDLAFFEEHGYVVVHDAVSPSARRAAEEAIWGHLGMDRDDPESWYTRPNGHSIWVPLLHHDAVWANRCSPRIRRAFEQLWGRSDLYPTVDQCGFNPPERSDWPFPGPRLHFDCNLTPPVPFGLQGILYLTDTAANQGAFTCVPGFHHRIDAWLTSFSHDGDPRTFDLYSLDPKPIAGRAGDLVIWHQALPHGASRNSATLPRIVQYITYEPTTSNEHDTWT
ncbi:MAG: phytanoyl-CoA dioxygenase family protein [bacterium]|nr:phytanoyl-CoA dioxygenase family protein [bacterium]